MLKKILKSQKLKNIVLFVLMFAFLVLVDQFVKQMVKVLASKKKLYVCVIPNFFNIDYVENSGIALGIFCKFNKYFLIAVAIILIAGLIIYFLKKHLKDNYSFFALLLIISGSIGNLLDRFFFGFVVDYISLSFFPFVFNLADIYITLGVMLMLFKILNKNHK